MSFNLSGFDATIVEPSTSFDPFPPNWYQGMIIKSEEKPTSKGGSYAELMIKVIEGEYEGRVVYDMLQLKNTNPIAVEIAEKTLSAICHAIDVMSPNDSDDLLNIPLMFKVAIEPASGKYAAKNVVKGYKAAESRKPVGNGGGFQNQQQDQGGGFQNQQQDQNQQQQQGQGKGPAPWK